MSYPIPPIFTLEPKLFGRVWGGQQLADRTGAAPPAGPVGEAWLVSDHPNCVSVVADGSRQGTTLHQLLQENAEALLGIGVKTTPDGRFPLLLKLLDCCEVLSIQVHPNDVQAAMMQEPDAGKTEMWYVLDAEAEGQVLCGLDPAMEADAFIAAAATGRIESAIQRWDAAPGMGFFVPSGTVHALGKGLLIAEIQQNSDLTYRVYDWGRTGTDGAPRELHLDKAAKVTTFGEAYPGPVSNCRRSEQDAECFPLATCEYFTAERIALDGLLSRETGGLLHLLLAIDGQIEVHAEGDKRILHPGRAVLVPGHVDALRLQGAGDCLLYTARRA